MKSPWSKENCIPMGSFVGVHGLKGGLVLRTRSPFWNQYHRFLCQPKNAAGFSVQVTKHYQSGGKPVVCLQGFENRDKAQNLVGMDVYVHRDDAQGMGEGKLKPQTGSSHLLNTSIPMTTSVPTTESYLVHDLLKMSVMYKGKIVGKVHAVHNFGAQETLEIFFTEAKGTHFIPFMSPFVIEVDTDRRTIEISCDYNEF